MKTNILTGVLFFLFAISFASCSNDNDEEKKVDVTLKIRYIQGGESMFHKISVKVFKADEEFLKDYNYNTTYNYFERKKDNALFPPSYQNTTYPYDILDKSGDSYIKLAVGENDLYTISYSMKINDTNFYFIEYNVEVENKDFVLERTFIIDSEGSVSKE